MATKRKELSADTVKLAPADPRGNARTKTLQRGRVNPDWNLERDPSGWLTVFRYTALPSEGPGPLALHAGHAGPVKYTTCYGEPAQRVDLFMGREAGMRSDPLLDETAAVEAQCLESRLLGCMEIWFSRHTAMPGWSPPPPELLSEWFKGAGFDPAVDRDGNLRVTLKRRGLDGQIRVERSDQGRLRIRLPLGSWKNLSASSETAALQLAGEANGRGRLARVAWITEGDMTRCEAQTDLSGLPWCDHPDRPTLAMWQGTIRMAMLALKLTLLRLGLELPLLCEAEHASVKEWMLESPRIAL
jgi:hypothetical protein